MTASLDRAIASGGRSGEAAGLELAQEARAKEAKRKHNAVALLLMPERYKKPAEMARSPSPASKGKPPSARMAHGGFYILIGPILPLLRAS